MGDMESLRLLNQCNAGQTVRPHVHQTLSANTCIRIEQINPKKKDSKSYARHEACKKATTVNAYINMHQAYGKRHGTMQHGTTHKQAWSDFINDVEKEYITVVDIDILAACSNASRGTFKQAATLTT